MFAAATLGAGAGTAMLLNDARALVASDSPAALIAAGDEVVTAGAGPPVLAVAVSELGFC